jgi:hypothetical protein
MTMIKKLKDIYPGYFQKSRVFLYPLICNKKGSITPIETYTSWEGHVKDEDMKLVCMFYLRNDSEFISFEERVLLNSPYYLDYKELDEKKALYLFDFSDRKDDWNYYLKGQYSKLSNEQKKRIRSYYGISTANYAFIHSYLYPEEYFNSYANFLSPNKEDVDDMEVLLREVGELCSKPNFDKEMLKISVISLEFKDL